MNYYRLIIFTFLVFVSLSLGAQTKISTGNGDWSNAATWSPSGVPGAGNDVIITGNHRVNITANASCRSLTVGTGGNAQLRFQSNTNRVLTVTGNVVVSANARFRVRQFNATHTLVAGANITNNGSVEFYSSANRNVVLVLNANANQNVTGTGTLTRFHIISLQMGSSFNNIADFNTSNFTVNSDFLNLVSGTFRYSKTAAQNITPFTTAVTIPANAGIWMNSSTSIMSLPNGIIVSGKMSNSNGTITVGNATNETLLYSGGTFSFTGGVTRVAGRFNGNVAASTCNFNMSGGTFSVPSVGTTNTTEAPFKIGTPGSQFNMSGGTILLFREGGTGAQNLGYVNLAGSGTVNGGTVQIGNATSPATQIYNINSTALIPNLVLNNATATASLLTNALTVTNTIKITLGTLNSNNLGITLGGNWENNGGTFTPGTATVTFNSNAAQSIFKSGGETFNHLRFSGTGTKTFSSAVTSSGNFSISANSPVDVSASNHQLTVRGNFINDGSFNARSGLVFFNGTTAQTIGGISTTDFFNMQLTNTAGASLTGSENLVGTFTLSGGTFNTNSQVFTMVSTATATARIAQLTGTGDITGQVRVQRFVPGGSTGWALWGTPISSALSFNDWDDDIFISCPTCPDGYVPNFPSVYSYSEAAIGSYSDAAAYVAINTINDPIIPNRGYWVYVGDGQTTTNGITVDVTGTLRKGNQTISLSRTNTGNPADDGWNLIHNPYPSPISWTALRNGNANVDNAIYCYNADLNGGTGASASFVNGVSSPAVGSGGIGDNIPMSQGFYVHVTNNTNLTAQESNKVASTQAYLKSVNQNSMNLLRINLSGGPSGFSEEAVVYTEAMATPNFDDHYDAYKLAGFDPYAPSMALECGSDLLQINGIPHVNGTYTTYVKALTGYNGTYSISAIENTFPVGTCVSLFDRFTLTTTDLTTSNYAFNLVDTTTVSRFILSITLNTLQVTSNIVQPTCQNSNAGEIIAIGNTAGPWNYFWKDAGGNPIQTSLNHTTADTLTGLSNGNFQLEITTVGGCDNHQSTYNIIEKQAPYSSFTSVDTCFIDQDPIVVFNNSTPNAVSQSWDFGDSNTSTSYAPQNQYQAVGQYTVKLISTSSSGCNDSATKTIVVMNKAVGVKTNSFNSEIKVRTLSPNHYLVEQELKAPGKLSYTIKDTQGKLVLKQNESSVKRIQIDLDLDNYKAGIYFLTIDLDSSIHVVKLSVE